MAFDFGNANEAQRSAISTTDGPLLIIAGPGERGIFVTGGRNSGFTRVSEALS